MAFAIAFGSAFSENRFVCVCACIVNGSRISAARLYHCHCRQATTANGIRIIPSNSICSDKVYSGESYRGINRSDLNLLFKLR